MLPNYFVGFKLYFYCYQRWPYWRFQWRDKKEGGNFVSLRPVYMEESYPGKWAGSVTDTNYLLRLYGTFHPVYREKNLIDMCLLESLKNQLGNSFYARAFQHFSSR